MGEQSASWAGDAWPERGRKKGKPWLGWADMRARAGASGGSAGQHVGRSQLGFGRAGKALGRGSAGAVRSLRLADAGAWARLVGLRRNARGCDA